jgi:hypothetical protein
MAKRFLVLTLVLRRLRRWLRRLSFMDADMVMLVRAFGWVSTPPRAIIMDRAFTRPRWFLMWLRCIRTRLRIMAMDTAIADTGHVIMAADIIAAVTLAGIAGRSI